MSIYTMKPVNGTAATVVSQKGCTDGELTDEQRRENLVTHLKSLMEQIKRTPKGPERKLLGQKQHELTQQIRAIRPKRRAPGVEKYVMDILREEMTNFQFRSILSRASERMRQENDEM